MRQLQVEHKAWLDRMYPDQPLIIPAAGMVEEAGELLHALLALERLRIWGKEPRYGEEKVRADMLDAIGDCAIYVCSLCNTNGMLFDSVMQDGRARRVAKVDTPVLLATDLVRTAVEIVRNPHNRHYVTQYVSTLRTLSELCGLDLEQVARLTWQKVKERKRCE